MTIHYLHRHPTHMIAERSDAPFPKMDDLAKRTIKMYQDGRHPDQQIPATEQYPLPDDPLEHDVARMWGFLFGIAGVLVTVLIGAVAAWCAS